ncbi:hypothetical protein B0T14DRAFT_141363 [Immersiella caudata]|uniref:Uncharacterized protein n=1 Tax=Immersiella caudata TaxID=314043 RepID=A0AA39X5G5_9PEZI|nr:hypothetical protein B0T14DRAFT_141363 [Immersiella caudata]
MEEYKKGCERHGCLSAWNNQADIPSIYLTVQTPHLFPSTHHKPPSSMSPSLSLLALAALPFTSASYLYNRTFISTRQDTTIGDLTAQITLGKTQVDFSTRAPTDILGEGIRTLCGTNGCDGGSVFTTPKTIASFTGGVDPPRLECTWSVRAEGNYDRIEERDYMLAVMAESFSQTATDRIVKSPVSSIICPPACDFFDQKMTTGVGFLQVVLNKPDGSNTAQLSATMNVDCVDGLGFDCPKAVSGNLKDALSEIPGVGPIIAQIFNIACL